MKFRLAVVTALFTAMAVPPVAVAASAGAAEDPSQPVEVDTSGPDSFETVTEVTPEITENFPELGDLSERVPDEQLQQGGPILDAVEAEATDDN